MELLNPFPLPDPPVDRFSSSSMATRDRVELTRQPSHSERSENITEEENHRRREKVYIAVGKSMEKTRYLLQWTFRNFRSADFCLVHVHQPSPFIPTLLGKLPATQANPDVVSAYRREERENVNKLINAYLDSCHKAKVKTSAIITEDEQVHKGLLNLVLEHGIQKLVIGCVKMKKNSHKGHYAAKNAPAFCQIWFIHKGKFVWTKEAFEELPTSAECQADKLRSKSFQYNKSERAFNPVNFCSRSSRISMLEMDDSNKNEYAEEDLRLPSSGNHYEPGYARRSTSNDSALSTSSERMIISNSGLKLEEEFLCGLLLEAKAEIRTSKDEALLEYLRSESLEAEAIKAVKKVKELESTLTCENKLIKEAEDSLKHLMQEQQLLLEERLKVTGELQKTMRNVAVLNSRVQEANRRGDEAAGELRVIQGCVMSLRQEKLQIERQKLEAERWLEKWRNRRQTGGTNRHVGVLDDVPELVEFSLLDLQTATCNFSDSFKLNEGGYGSIYKGELLGRTVAIKRLHAHDIQGPSQFQKQEDLGFVYNAYVKKDKLRYVQVQVFSKLRHPNLVTLIGACSEAWSLVYEYVPKGCLNWHLFHKSNIAPLSWKVRARIIYQISSALLFIHSSHPEKIIHGDLKPECILLDSDLHCKICDFGISSLLSQDTCFPNSRQFPEPHGSFPYRDPEFYRTGKLSPKSDLYSFGLIILQLLTGLPPVGLVASVRRAVSIKKLDSILDPSGGEWAPLVAEKLADVALRFCEQNNRDRLELTPTLVKELQQLYTSKERPVPSFFLCPIFQEIMLDPQVAADGFTYEGNAIREWLENGRETSPMTNLRLDHLHLTPNHSLRLAIQEWLWKC